MADSLMACYCARVNVGALETCPCFFDAVFRILRSAGKWRLFPASLGKWKSLQEGCRQLSDVQRFLEYCKIAHAITDVWQPVRFHLDGGSGIGHTTALFSQPRRVPC